MQKRKDFVFWGIKNSHMILLRFFFFFFETEILSLGRRELGDHKKTNEQLNAATICELNIKNTLHKVAQQ